VKLPRFRNVILIAVVLALLTPAYCLIRHALDPKYYVWHIEFLLWPTLVLLYMREVAENSTAYYALLGASIAGNMLLYAILCAALWGLAWLIGASIRSLRGVPTDLTPMKGVKK
jgi:hypothetical protein